MNKFSPKSESSWTKVSCERIGNVWEKPAKHHLIAEVYRRGDAELLKAGKMKSFRPKVRYSNNNQNQIKAYQKQ